MKSYIFALIAIVLQLTCVASGQSQELYVRVVDVGAGLCCVVVTPDHHYMIYDAGNYKDQGSTAIAAIRELVPAGSTIDLLVLSHRDADHLAAAPAICNEYKVKRVIRDGFEGTTQTWKKMKKAIKDEVEDDGCEDLNLKTVDLEFGKQFSIGASAVATFVCGFYELPEDWPELSDSEDVNARSIVVRLEFGESSILFGAMRSAVTLEIPPMSASRKNGLWWTTQAPCRSIRT